MKRKNILARAKQETSSMGAEVNNRSQDDSRVNRSSSTSTSRQGWYTDFSNAIMTAC